MSKARKLLEMLNEAKIEIDKDLLGKIVREVEMMGDVPVDAALERALDGATGETGKKIDDLVKKYGWNKVYKEFEKFV